MTEASVAATRGEAKQASLQVGELDSSRFAEWDAFVDSHAEGTIFHRTGWKTAIEKAFGHGMYYLLAESEGAIQGLLPLGHVKSRIFGNALISTPFAVYGGVIAGSATARLALEKAAEDLALELGVDYLELRNQQPSREDWPTKDLYVTFRKEIDPDPEKNLKAIPRKQRAMVRKGIQSDLKSEVDDDLDRFFDIYAESLHNLGTPVFPKRYFRALLDVFGKDCEILTVTNGGRAVASVLSFFFRDEVLPYYGGGTAEARQLKANDFMYWEVMRRASLRGIRVFDYGRSKRETGSYSFKKNWGFVPESLAYQYLLVKADEVPNVSPVNPRYRLLVSLWKRLPLWVSKALGPLVSDSLA